MRAISPVSRPSANCRANLHGALDQVGLPALLTMLDLERRSGVLLIRRNGEVGRLWLRHGRVIRAQIEAQGRYGGARRIVAHLHGDVPIEARLRMGAGDGDDGEGERGWTGKVAACRILGWEEGRFELTRD